MTFSIIAYDKIENKVGISTCSAVPFIGKYSLFIFPNVCAISAQGKIDPSTAFNIRDLIIQDKTASEINNFLKSRDSAYERKQTSFINLRKHEFFSYTGSELLEIKTPQGIAYGNSIVGKNYIISANLMTSLDTLTHMENAFLTSNEDTLEKRLLISLEAGNQSPADIRGRQSAALRVFELDKEYPKITIDVDEHENPVEELRRIFDYSQENWQIIPDTCFVDKDFDYEKLWAGLDWATIMPKIKKFEQHVKKRRSNI